MLHWVIIQVKYDKGNAKNSESPTDHLTLNRAGKSLWSFRHFLQKI